MANQRENRKRLSAIARNLKAARHLYKVGVMARVESEDDIAFWQGVIHVANPKATVKFLPSEPAGGVEARQRGKSVCMRYVPYLDCHLIVCVDSDFDNFIRPGALIPQRNILQTYTYSFENHYCWSVRLQDSWDALNLGNFDFHDFLLKLSHILYPVLISMLATKAAKKKAWSLTDLCGVILSSQVNRKGCLDNNGLRLLAEIEKNIQVWTATQKMPTKASYKKFETVANEEGLMPDTAYLFMQGHCIFDLIERIGNYLCNNHRNFLYEVLTSNFSTSGYAEMNHLLSDIPMVIES